MEKWKQKNAALFLVICMVLSMFTGIPVNAAEVDGEENEQEEIVNQDFGLKVIEWLDFVDVTDEETGEVTGQELLTIEEDNVEIPAYYNETEELVKHSYADYEKFTSFYGEDLWLDYVTSEGTTHVNFGDITVISPSGVDVTAQVISENEMDGRVIHFQPTEAGRYTITYKAGETNNSFTIQADYPEVGFYTSSEANAENLIKDDRFGYLDEENTFYLILKCDWSTIQLSEEAPFKIKDWDVDPDPDTYITDETEIAKYITYEAVEGKTGIYKVTVNTNKFFGLLVTATVAEDLENPTRDRWINVEPKIGGLVLKEWIDWSDEEPSIPSVNPEAEFAKEAGSDLYGTTLYLAYVEAEGGEETAVTAEDITITQADGASVGELASITPREEYPGFFDFSFKETGDYKVTYSKDDINSSIVIHVDYPVADFYTTGEMSAAGLIRDGEAPYDNENRTVYFIVNDNPDKTITDTEIHVNDWNENDIEIVPVEENKKYKITVKKDVKASFGLTATYNCKWKWEENSEPDCKEIYMSTEGGNVYTDGISHLGYAGCYISEYEFETCNGINGNSGNPLYWVHADTIQGVIDKLAAVAEGEEVLFNPLDPDDTATGIINTGYIHINVSHFGDLELEPQYISSSGNMKGIQFDAGNDYYFTVPDENHPLTEDGVYIEDKLYIVTEDGKKEFPALEEIDIVSRYCDELYKVVETTENGKTYYSLGEKLDLGLDTESENTISEANDEKMTLGAMLDSLDNNQAFGKYFDVYWMPAFQFPEIHVNMYSDMKFMGNMSELYIGFKEGQDCSATLFSMDEEGLEQVTEYSYNNVNDDTQTVNIVYEDKNTETGYSNSAVAVHLYEIDSTSQSDESSTYGTAESKVTVDVPEPNALPELNDDQRDAIEAGKKLTVSIKADTVDAEKTTDEIKTAIAGIQDKAEKEIGKNRAFTFLDLSVLATVDNVQGETKITETKAPMTVTVPLTKELQGKKSYAIVRYHGNGVGGHVDVLNAKLSEDGKALTFSTDKFSVYAIVYEKQDLDLSKAAWNYKEAFTYDGSAKTVELTGLPEGLTAAYTGNTATEPGTYTAQVTFSYDKAIYNAPDVSKISSLQWQIVKTEAPAPTPDPTPADAAKAGDTAAVDGNNYVVTSVADNQKTVTYVSGDKSATKVTIPSTISINGTEYKVTAIADNAFAGSSKLTTVTVSDSVTTIGKNAFYGCKKLTKVTVGKNVTAIGANAFSGCTKLKTVTMGANVTTIGDKAFYKCTALTKITIPAKVSRIGKQAFYGCKKLSSITIKTTKLTSKKVGSKAFKGIYSKAAIKVPKSKLASYKKILKAKGAGAKVKIKK